jgi:hypothetical protein
VLILFLWLRCCSAFMARPKHVCCGRITSNVPVPSSSCSLSKNDETSLVRESNLREEAKQLLEKARAIRSELPEQVAQTTAQDKMHPQVSSRWNVQPESSNGVDYRLYVDIGREEGTWMDSRWGASNRRIEFSLDVKFMTPSENENAYLANKEERGRMVKDNFGGTRSDVYKLKSANVARLRNGFDEVNTHGGAFRLDTATNGGYTARFYVQTDGTPEQGSSYGDVSIPKGCLHFSLPAFGGVAHLSKKEGIVTVRQTGWHTGWRREESRIVGTFRAVPIDDAKRRDRF